MEAALCPVKPVRHRYSISDRASGEAIFGGNWCNVVRLIDGTAVENALLPDDMPGL